MELLDVDMTSVRIFNRAMVNLSQRRKMKMKAIKRTMGCCISLLIELFYDATEYINVRDTYIEEIKMRFRGEICSL